MRAQRRTGTRLVTRRRSERASAAGPATERELEEAFFSQPPLASANAPDLDEPSAELPLLTPWQAMRRQGFRRRVQHLMAGLTAFTGIAVLAHVAQLG